MAELPKGRLADIPNNFTCQGVAIFRYHSFHYNHSSSCTSWLLKQIAYSCLVGMLTRQMVPWYYLLFASGKLWIQIPLCPSSVKENNALVDRCANHSAQPFHAVPACSGIVRTLQARLAIPFDLINWLLLALHAKCNKILVALRANNATGAKLFDPLTMRSCCVQRNDLSS